MPINHSEITRKKGTVRGRECRDQSLNTKLTATEFASVEAAAEADGRALASGRARFCSKNCERPRAQLD